MPDIFISYAREDRPLVQRLAAQLERKGWSVWWDRLVLAGKHYDDEISRALDETKAVIVVWSVHSVSSKWVRAEANEGLKRDILVPVQFDDSQVPLPFRMVQGIQLEGRSIMAGSRAYQELIAALESLIGERAPAVAAAPEPAPVAPSVVEPPAPPEPAAPDSITETAPAPDRKKLFIGAAAAAAVLILAAAGYVATRPRQTALEPAAQSTVIPAPSIAPSSAPAQPPAPVPTQPSEPAPAETPAPASTAAPIEAPEEVRAFVESFLRAMEGVDYDAILALYAPRVDYFDSGMVGADFIRKDRGYFHQRWPSRRLRLEGQVTCTPAEGSTTCAGPRMAVSFQVRFTVSSPSRQETRDGLSEVTMVLEAIPAGGFAIAGQKETVR